MQALTPAARNLDEVLSECHAFDREFRSLLIASCNADSEPEASYAPYIKHQGSYYVYLSELAAHTGNLLHNERCSVLFIENEADAKYLFARRRLTLRCVASEVARDSDAFDEVFDQMEAQFGNFMRMMRNLTDFHLFQLEPESASYVSGFAQAYSLTGEGLQTIRLRNEAGHRRTKTPDTQTTD